MQVSETTNQSKDTMKTKTFPYTLDPEQIPTAKVVDFSHESGEHIDYACPGACWPEHLDGWRKALRAGHRNAPQPMPYGHCEFETPEQYGVVRYGDKSMESRRKAFEHRVRANLDGWDRDVDKETLDKIVKVTVDAKMAGQDVGAFPYMACISATL